MHTCKGAFSFCIQEQGKLLNVFECDKYHAKPNEFLTSPSKKINQAELFSPICIFFQGNSIRSRKSIRSAVKSSEIILKDGDSQLFAPFYARDADGRLNSRFPSWKMSPQGSIALNIGTLLKPSKRETGNNQEFEADQRLFIDFTPLIALLSNVPLMINVSLHFQECLNTKFLSGSKKEATFTRQYTSNYDY